MMALQARRPGLGRTLMVLLLVASVLGAAVDLGCALANPEVACCAGETADEGPDECHPGPSTVALSYVPAAPPLRVFALEPPDPQPAWLPSAPDAPERPPHQDWVRDASGLRAPPRSS